MSYLDQFRNFTNATEELIIPNPVKFTGTVDLTDATVTGMTLTASVVAPDATDGAALGSTSLMWSDLFLASGAVINFNSGDVTITHSSNALTFAGASSGYTFDAPVSVTAWGTTYTDSALRVGAYGTPIADTALTDNILVSINGSTATEKTVDDSSCMALFVGMRNTALTNQPHTKLQSILISTLVYANCFDAYGVQGHIAVKGDATAVAGGTNIGNVCGGSFKATVDSGKTATATVSGVLITLDGAGTVTGTHSGMWIDATVSCDNGILLSSTGTCTAGINMTGTITSAFVFGANGAGVVHGGAAAAAVQGYISIKVGSTAYRIPYLTDANS
jgi:hypothetical protein